MSDLILCVITGTDSLGKPVSRVWVWSPRGESLVGGQLASVNEFLKGGKVIHSLSVEHLNVKEDGSFVLGPVPDSIK